MESDHEHAKGYVYILTNPSFHGNWVRIGKSSHPVDVLSKEFNNPSVPLPFVKFAVVETVKSDDADSIVNEIFHDLADHRISPSREFFIMNPFAVLKMFRGIISKYRGAKIFEYEHGGEDPVPPRGTKPPFRFSMIGIEIGETVTFTPTNVDVKVVSDTKVVYEGQGYTLAEFARKFIPENKRDASNSYWELAYFTYKGQRLIDILIPPPTSGERFDFRKVGIGAGETVTFTPTNTNVRVAADKNDSKSASKNRIEYEGREYSLSGFAKEFMPDEWRTKSNSYQGPKYFTYKGRKLVDIWDDYLQTKEPADPNTNAGQRRY